MANIFIKIKLCFVVVLVILVTVCADNNTGKKQLRPPVIDIAPILHPNQHSVASRKDAITAVQEAMAEWGFFHAINHDIPSSLQEDLLKEMTNFFVKTSLEEKEKLSRNATNSRGYTNKELTKQKVDLKEILDIGPFSETIPSHAFVKLSPQGKADLQLDGFNNWPDLQGDSDDKQLLTDFRSTVETFYDSAYVLSMKLLQALTSTIVDDSDNAVNKLKPRGACLSSYSDDIINQFTQQMHSSFLRLNYYPLQPAYSEDVTVETTSGGETSSVSSHKPLGISRHTDAGVLTILLQHQSIPSQHAHRENPVSALEVYTGTKQDNGDGEWVPVTPIPNAITVNGGDMLQVWSNNRLKAAEHRVQASYEQERYSAAFFLNPAYDTVVKPVPECSAEEEGISLYQPIRWGTYRIHRFFGDYADVGEEIQIEGFKADK